MKKDELFLKNSPRIEDFEFNHEVSEVFDNMIIRSIPLYLEQQDMFKKIAKKFFIPGTNVYDLGCSTATTLINLCRGVEQPGHFIGYDNSVHMLERANEKIKEAGLENRIEVRYADLNGDLSKIQLDNASVVTMCWTMQFIRPIRRDKLIKWIYNALVEEGAFIVAEKVLTSDTNMNRYFIDFYYDFKRHNSYNELEIMRKREALENVLIPYRIDENIEMFKRNGFEIVDTFFQYYNFSAFLCLKKLI